MREKMSQLTTSLIKLAAFALIATNTAQAQNEMNDGPFFGKEAPGKWIIGAKAGKIDANSELVDDADAVGVVLGYEFARPIGNLGGSSTIELEYLKGDETPISGFGDYEVDMLNLFFTYRSAGKLYFKAKAGASFSTVTLTTPGFEQDVDDISIAAGFGFGYRVGDYGVVELEYSDDTGDTDLGVIALNALLEF